MSKDKKDMSKSNFFQLLPARDSQLELRIKHCRMAIIDQWTYPDAIHSYWRFYWNPEPGAEIEHNGTVWKMTSDKVFLIPPFTRLSTRSDRPFRHCYIHFEASAPFDRVRRGVLTFPSGEIRSFFRSLGTGETPISYPARLHQMICHYLGLIPAEQFAERGTSILDPRIQRAAELLSAHIRQPLSNRELCRKAGMNLNDFYLKFREGLGVTPKQYLFALRMELAREKLLHTVSGLEEIAEECGYADRFQFSKAFRKSFGIPPAAYRKKYRP